MPILIVVAGVIILLFLIMKLRLNTFVSLVIVSFIVAILLGMDLPTIVKSIETGIGGQLGHLALVFGFGAMLGKLVSDAGGGYRIAITRCMDYCRNIKALFRFSNSRSANHSRTGCPANGSNNR